MRAVGTIHGTMLPLDRSDVDTDQIIPQQFLKRVERTGYGDFLFYNWAHDDKGRPVADFVTNRPEYRLAKVLVVGPNFGCGSSREHAAWAIQDRGFEAVVAPSVADIFRNNCHQIGVLVVELPNADTRRIMEIAANPRAQIRIDLPAQTLTTGETETTFEVDQAAKRRLLEGLDQIDVTLQEAQAIGRYEKTRSRWLPSLS